MAYPAMLRATVGIFLLGTLAAATPAAAQIQAEAYLGQPFGVGRLTVTVPRAADREVGDDGYFLSERHERALYSALVDKPVQRLLRNLFNEGRPILQRPEQVTVYFLFKGDAPLELTFYTPDTYHVAVVPRHDPRHYNRLLQAWWREYSGQVRQLDRAGEYPMLVESYLTPMLAQRMGLPLPQMFLDDQQDEFYKVLELLAGTEAMEANLLKHALLNVRPEPEAATLPLPAPLPPAVEVLPVPGDKTDIEPMAMHVPEESLYVRFGNFPNYLWLRQFLSTWGGDVQNMVQVRGLDYGVLERREKQIALRESALAEVLGPTVIADVAFVGFDTFMREGPAFGILFQARNNLALRSDFMSQRQAVLNNNPAARQETVKIAGREVLFLHTPDNTVRSFYAVDGNFHLVSTSRELVRRFFEAGEGKGALGNLPDFRAARARLPVERQETVFAYLSEPFFRQLVSPHYRIEMMRRMRASIEIQLVKLARLAARAEGIPARTVEELIAARLLPEGFARRPDGSRPVEQGEDMIDSLRGQPRTFLPVADVEITGITPSESRDYERFAQFYQNEWKQMDPIAVSLKREPLNDQGLDRLNIELVISPYLREHYGPVGKWLGEPSHRTVRPIPGDIVFFNAVMGKALAGGPPEAPDYLLFGGLRDFKLPLTRDGDKLRFALGPRPLQFIEGYIGAWPFSGVLALANGLHNGPPREDAFGFSPVALGLAWQRRWGDFTVLSLSREMLEFVTPQLEVVEVEDPAQLRLHVVDLNEVGAARSLDALAFMRAREATVSNSRFINRLADQLRVPRSQSRAVGEDLLEAQFVSALGGDYELVQFPSGLKVWMANALDARNQFAFTAVPEEYQFPLLRWFRGLDVRLLLTEEALNGWITLDLQGAPPKPGGGFQLPTLPSLPQLPSLPGFGSRSNDQGGNPDTDNSTDTDN